MASKPAKKTAPAAKTAPAVTTEPAAVAAELTPQERWPLSHRATPQDVRAANLINGMDLDAVEAALARVMV